jgi:hypothetical protein
MSARCHKFHRTTSPPGWVTAESDSQSSLHREVSPQMLGPVLCYLPMLPVRASVSNRTSQTQVSICFARAAPRCQWVPHWIGLASCRPNLETATAKYPEPNEARFDLKEMATRGHRIVLQTSSSWLCTKRWLKRLLQGLRSKEKRGLFVSGG